MFNYILGGKKKTMEMVKRSMVARVWEEERRER